MQFEIVFQLTNFSLLLWEFDTDRSDGISRKPYPAQLTLGIDDWLNGDVSGYRVLLQKTFVFQICENIRLFNM